MGKVRLKTVGVWGTKQVMGRQLTRPFLVRDAPKPHPVCSAPPPPRPEALERSPHTPRASHTAGQRAHLPTPRLGKKKTGGWFTAGSPMSNIWALRTLRKKRRFAFSTPFLTSTSPLTSGGKDASPHVPRGPPCGGLLGDDELEDEGGVWPWRFLVKHPAGRLRRRGGGGDDGMVMT